MKIHEYQARDLLSDAGVPVPPSSVVETVEEAVDAFNKINSTVVVKAQVFAGGRGKAGFVKLCKSADEVKDAAQFMLTNRMVSPVVLALGIMGWTGIPLDYTKVSIAAVKGVPPPATPANPNPRVERWTPAYMSDADRSGLTVTVEPGRNTHDFELTSERP